MTAEVMMKVEILPTDVTPPSQIYQLKKFSFSNLLAYKNIMPFLFYKEKSGTRVHYKARLYTDNIKKHFEHFKKQFADTTVTKKKQWEHVNKRLIVPPDEKQNVDRRQCLKFNEHFFVVKKYFTTGLRQVEPGCVHLYQVGHHPIHLFVATERTALKNGLPLQPRTFIDQKQFAYDMHQLDSWQNYRIPSNLIYVVVTYCHAYFAMYKVDENAPLTIKYNTIRIPKDKILGKSGTVRKEKSRTASFGDNILPPATPCIEDFHIHHDSDEENYTDHQDLMDFANLDSLRMPPPAVPSNSECTVPSQTASSEKSSPAPATSTVTSPAPAVSTVTFTLMPLDWGRKIQVMNPDKVKWYQGMFQNKVMDKPPTEVFQVFPELGTEQQDALDLRTPRKAPSPVKETVCAPPTVQRAEQACQTEPEQTEDSEMFSSCTASFLDQIYSSSENIRSLFAGSPATYLPPESTLMPPPDLHSDANLLAAMNFVPAPETVFPQPASEPMECAPSPIVYTELTSTAPRSSTVYPSPESGPLNSSTAANSMEMYTDDSQYRSDSLNDLTTPAPRNSVISGPQPSPIPEKESHLNKDFINFNIDF